MVISILNFISRIKAAKYLLLSLSVLIFALGIPINAKSQTTTKYDSLDLARDMIYSQRIPDALIILNDLDNSYPSDENIMILYSQALYWNKDFSKTIAYIKNNTTRKIYPEYLDFHFGKILFELYYHRDAHRYLSLYLEKHPDNIETLLMLSKIAYWQGNSSKAILDKIQTILNIDPHHVQGLEFKEEVLRKFAPELDITGSYFEDSQVLKAYITNANISYYRNAYVQPSIQLTTHQYIGGMQMMMPAVSNITFFSKSKTSLDLKAGVFKNSWSNGIIPTWTIGLTQKTFKNIDFSAEARRTPYLYTLASITENVTPTVLTTAIGKESGYGATGKIMAQRWQFNDDNNVKIISAWILLPIVNKSSFTFNIGYAFTISDSDHNRFVRDETILFANPPSFGQVLPGVFSPYFTPKDLIVHAALGKIDMKFGQKVSASINTNIGIYASIDNPNYVYYGSATPIVPNKNTKNPITPPAEDELVNDDIYKIFVPTRYLPLDLRGNLRVKANKAITFNTEYAYVETMFFKSHEISMGLKWKFVSR